MSYDSNRIAMPLKEAFAASTYVAHEPVRPVNGWKNESVGGNNSFYNGFVISVA